MKFGPPRNARGCWGPILYTEPYGRQPGPDTRDVYREKPILPDDWRWTNLPAHRGVWVEADPLHES